MAQDQPQDSVLIPLKIRAGVEIAGPVIYFTDKNNLGIEGYITGDINEKMAIFMGSGYADYKYSQYNYTYHNKGLFFKAGIDFNLLKPETTKGKYWAGVGLHYGLSTFTSEIPFYKHENYWGTVSSSIALQRSWGHYLEISPGFKAELIKNFTIGWSISLRKLIWDGTGKDLRPIFFPGYGVGGKPFSTALSYFISWNIPYKKIKVAIKQETPEEPSETETPVNSSPGQ
jgi:hypothetical protein